VHKTCILTHPYKIQSSGSFAAKKIRIRIVGLLCLSANETAIYDEKSFSHSSMQNPQRSLVLLFSVYGIILTSKAHFTLGVKAQKTWGQL
jgi:hypothetical protein